MTRKIRIMLLACFLFGALGGIWGYVNGSDLGFPAREETAAAGVSQEIEISAEGAILIDASDGSVLWEKNADKELYPASTTKIMTALVALEIMDETGANLSGRITVPEEAAGVEGSSVYLRAGEKLTMEEILYGMMLRSGNDAAMAAAICCGGDLETFVDRMNEKAAELGCVSTHFVNPSGLHNDEHRTTARDLAVISAEAMKNEDFRRIVAAETWQSADSGRSFTNKNRMLTEYDGATGIKIGYTKAAGRAFVGSARRGDRELIAVVLNDYNWFEDVYKLMDYGFKEDDR